ncbi:MAG: hypothetical protein GEU86_18355 [Actinophytocola sp.]|nr:hypothetical protein [Actinophytocola sp.]
MTKLPPPNGAPPDSTAAVSGLAREVEGLRRRIDDLASMPRKLRELARVVQSLADEVKASRPPIGTGQDAGCRSWLAAPVGPDAVRRVLDELVEWVTTVFLRYADARKGLPECWLWHPDIVEELLWLMQAWQTAYAAETASAFQAADWHDRYRPGVVRRLPQLARNCSLEQHAQSAGDEQPLMDEATRERIAQWWGGSDPRGPAPIPPADDHDLRGEHDR